MRFLIMPASFVLAIGLMTAAGTAIEPSTGVIHIGILPTIYRGGEPLLAAAIKEPLVREADSKTGFDCKFDLMLGLQQMQRQLNDGRLQFALCHGFEFAWMKVRNPNLKPLMIAAPDHRPLKAFIVTAVSNPAKTLSELQGKAAAIPIGGHPLVTLFADRKDDQNGKAPIEYFEKITKPENAETALHDLYENRVQAAIVDGAALQCFEERYPARSKRLHTLVESAPFPMSVVVTREGAVSSAVLRRFQVAMDKAHESARSRHLMGLIHTVGFEALPADYERQLDEFVKRYPPPIDSSK